MTKRFQVRILGGLPSDERFSVLPANWEVLPFGSVDVGEFLRGLDFYVYFHSKDWVEAFGIAIAEALAVGLVTILAPSFEPLFEEGALYGHPGDVKDLVRRLAGDPAGYAAQSERARALVERKFFPQDYVARFESLIEEAELAPRFKHVPWEPERVARRSANLKRRPRRVLFISSNGVGLGHITRQLAIATRLPAGIDAAFFTLSQGCSLVAEFGFPYDYVPSHQSLSVDAESWNASFGQEVANAIDYYDPEPWSSMVTYLTKGS